MTWVVRAIRSVGGVVRLRSVTFPSSTMHDRDEIWVAKGRRRAGDGPDRRRPRQPRAPHGKAQFGWFEARRMRLSVRTRAQNALSRDVPRPECAFPSRRGAREVWGNPPPGCGALWRMSQLGKCARATPPPGCGVGCAGVRKSRLGVWSHGKAHSEALWPSHLTKNRTLQPVPHQKPQFGWSEARRMRLSVRTRAQNALFRKMRFSSPAQTSSHLTEKRTLSQPPHGKPHSGPAASRKSAFCPAASPKTTLCPRLASLNMVPRRPRLTHCQGSGAQSARSRRCHSRGSRPWVCLRCPG